MEPESEGKVSKLQNIPSKQLALNTQGCCFFCLKVVSNESTNNNTGGKNGGDQYDQRSPRRPTFFQNLCHHLDIDQKKILNGISTEERLPSEENLTLCQSCLAITSKFTELFQQLEKIQMEINICLSKINKEMLETCSNSELTQDYSHRLAMNSVSFAQFAFIDKLRKEISQKITSGTRNKNLTNNSTEQQQNRLPLPIIIKAEENSDSDDVDDTAPIGSPLLSPEALSSASTTTFPSPSHSQTHQNLKAHPRRKKKTENVTGKLQRTSRKSICLFDKATRKYTCFKCLKVYNSQTGCWSHYQLVHLNKHYKCGKCNRTFSQLHNINLHSKLCQETPEQKLARRNARKNDPSIYKETNICKTCGRKCESGAKLKIHIKAVHLNERKFSCQKCEKTFKTKNTLRMHLKNIHVRERFKCKVCNKEFSLCSQWRHEATCLKRTMARKRKRELEEQEDDTSSYESEEEPEDDDEEAVEKSPPSPDVKIEADTPQLSEDDDEDSS